MCCQHPEPPLANTNRGRAGSISTLNICILQYVNKHCCFYLYVFWLMILTTYMLCDCENKVWHHCIHLLDVCSFPVSSHPSLSFPNNIICSLFLSLILSLNLLISSTPIFPSFLPPCLPSTCTFLCGWWPQQALANVSSATSSSLQPLMMRKPLLRHWVCRVSIRLKRRLTRVSNPWEKDRGKMMSMKSFVQRLCVLFFCLFCWDGLRHILSQNGDYVSFLFWSFFLSYNVVCPSFTQQWGGT